MDAFTPILTSLGLPGLVIFALGWWGLSRSKKVDELQAARVEDIKLITEVVEQTRATNEKLVNAVASMTDEIRRGG